MNKRIFILVWIFVFLVAMISGITGCAKTLEQDARDIAILQLQKNKQIRKLLASNDSIEKMNLLEQIRTLENSFDASYVKYQKKYSSPAEWDDFEQAYIRHLKYPKQDAANNDRR
jgi:hypothetical protein